MAGIIERSAEGLGSFLGIVLGSKAFLWFVFLFFTVAWTAFAFMLVASPGRLDEVWQWIRSLPLLVQLVMWLLLLPLMIGLWIWQTEWASWLKVVLILGLGSWTILVMWPRN